MTTWFSFLERPTWQQLICIVVLMLSLSLICYQSYFSSIRHHIAQQKIAINLAKQKNEQRHIRLSTLKASLSSHPPSHPMAQITIETLYQEVAKIIQQTSSQLHHLTLTSTPAKTTISWTIQFEGQFMAIFQFIQKIKQTLPMSKIEKLSLKRQEQHLLCTLNITQYIGNTVKGK